MPTFLNKSYSLAGPNYNRWLVPPAALAIHLCIGMAYGFSVFWIPLSQAIGVSAPLACPPETNWWQYLFITDCDWPISMLGWMYTLFFVLLGLAAAAWGGWIEREGPRKAAFVSACCWCGGLLISAVGIRYHQLWMLWLGSGVIGGIGLGLGYISPISTLIKWFPDHRGMATGMAIMGFGGGAMIGSPLANRLMQYFETTESRGVWETFCVLAILYFTFMLFGALSYRLPAEGWQPKGFIPKPGTQLVTKGNVDVNTAMRTPQFWLLWIVLCMNVTAGIGILGMASPLLQEIFGGRLIGLNLTLPELSADQKKSVATAAAGFIGLLSLFNIAGRFFWSTLSDTIGRKYTYHIFLAAGCLLYWAVPELGRTGNLLVFAGALCIIMSMYGGGFATIPAYLADLFGTKMVSAIHGRLLTAWSTAGVLGPVLVNYLRENRLSRGVPAAEAYNDTMLLLSALLVIGLMANLLIRPVSEQYFMPSKESLSEHLASPTSHLEGIPNTDNQQFFTPMKIVAAWAVVLLPLLWGLSITFRTAATLFR